MLYSQIICNSCFQCCVIPNKLLVISSNHLIPSAESFVLQSLVQSLLETVYLGVVICAEISLFLWVALQSLPPFPEALPPSHCWSPSDDYSTNNSCGPRPLAGAGCDQLCSSENLTTFIISSFLSHQLIFLGHFSF